MRGYTLAWCRIPRYVVFGTGPILQFTAYWKQSWQD